MEKETFKSQGLRLQPRYLRFPKAKKGPKAPCLATSSNRTQDTWQTIAISKWLKRFRLVSVRIIFNSPTFLNQRASSTKNWELKPRWEDHASTSWCPLT